MTRSALLVSVVLAIASVASSAADEGDAIYKKKCAGCHGVNGEGKPAVKAPALKGTTRDVAQITDQITKGEATSKAPHNKGIAGLSEDQAKAVAEFVKSLK